MTTGYTILRGTTHTDLVQQVNKRLNQGWQPLGAPTHTLSGFTQAMVKKAPPAPAIPAKPKKDHWDFWLVWFMMGLTLGCLIIYDYRGVWHILHK